MKKVLVVGMTPNPGGVESVIMNYYRKINKKIINFEFLSYYDNLAYEDEIIGNGSLIKKVGNKRRKYFEYKNNLKNVIKNGNYDAVWLNACSLSNIDVLKLAKKFKIKTRIIHAHNSKIMNKSIITKILHFFNKFKIGKVATHFWSCSELASKFFYNKLIRKSNDHKIIYNAIDYNKFKFDSTLRNKTRTLLGVTENNIYGHVGRFHFQKNHEFLIDIFYEILKKDSSAILLLIGKGEDEEKIKSKCMNLGILNNVRFLGVQQDVNAYYNAMDFFVFPSLFEGLPVTLVEAQFSGLKIFASDTISKKSKLIDSMEFISLNKSPSGWATIICQNDKPEYNKRNKYSETLKDSKFNIDNQIQDFQNTIC